MTAARLRSSGRFVRPAKGGSTESTINSLGELMRLMNPAARTATPIRPAGARSASTSAGGIAVIDSGF